jgi:hypothetical protein
MTAGRPSSRFSSWGARRTPGRGTAGSVADRRCCSRWGVRSWWRSTTNAATTASMKATVRSMIPFGHDAELSLAQFRIPEAEDLVAGIAKLSACSMIATSRRGAIIRSVLATPSMPDLSTTMTHPRVEPLALDRLEPALKSDAIVASQRVQGPQSTRPHAAARLLVAHRLVRYARRNGASIHVPRCVRPNLAKGSPHRLDLHWVPRPDSH